MDGSKLFIRENVRNCFGPRRKELKFDVPQGSALGPTLFLTYIHSVSKLHKCVRVKLLADETTIVYFSGKILMISNRRIENDL